MPDLRAVHFFWEDPRSYCNWKGTHLPTEAEWLIPGGHQANLWQGTLPDQDGALDGFGSHRPVKQFPANGYGLYEHDGQCLERGQ